MEMSVLRDLKSFSTYGDKHLCEKEK